MVKYKILIVFLLLLSCGLAAQEETAADSTTVAKPKITMLELGSTSCIPCKMMEPVMESLQENYGEQIRIIFYDVKKEKEKAAEWKIRMIPTQVFLDEEGKEIHRHVGFYSEELIDEFLLEQGLIKLTESDNEE